MISSKRNLALYACFPILALTVAVAYFTGVQTRSVQAGEGPTVTTVASNLHNPRGLNFGPDGALYVAEAGGNGTASDDCGQMGDGSTKCFATTGSVTRIDLQTGATSRILTDLPSLISPDGTANGATGVHDISFQGFGNTMLTIGLGGDPTLRDDYFGANGPFLARLVRANPSGKVRFAQDLGGFEAANNPDGVVPDSNPYGLLQHRGNTIVTDAGGNDLLKVSAKGEVSVLAVFAPVARNAPGGPPFVQAVPTSVALGPDGSYYVGTLTGGPFTVGIANVYRVPQEGGTPEVAFSGFTNIIDLAFGPDGSLYVLEIARNSIFDLGAGGRLVRIAPDGTRTDILSGMPLFAPGGIAVGPDGALYVTNRSISPTVGEVLKIVL